MHLIPYYAETGRSRPLIAWFYGWLYYFFQVVGRPKLDGVIYRGSVVFTQAPTLDFGGVLKKIQVCEMCPFEKLQFWDV